MTREARGGTLVLGGGFAGSWVARLLGKRGARDDDRQPRERHAVHAASARGGLGDARAAPRRRAAPDDVPAVGADPRRARGPRHRASATRPSTRTAGRSRSATNGSSSRSAPSRGRSRSRASPSTGSGSRISPTRSRCATTSCGRWRRPTPRRTRRMPRRHLTFVFVGAGYAGVEALAELSDLVRDALRFYPRLQTGAVALGARRRRTVDPARDPDAPRRVRGEGARATRRRHPGLDDARVRRRGRRDALGRRADRDAHARLDGGRAREPAARGARPAAGRARTDPRRRLPPGRGMRGRLGARRLRRRAERGDAGHGRPADLPARAAPGETAREESDGDARSRIATGCSARWRRSGATRGSPMFSAFASAAFPAGG